MLIERFLILKILPINRTFPYILILTLNLLLSLQFYYYVKMIVSIHLHERCEGNITLIIYQLSKYIFLKVLC